MEPTFGPASARPSRPPQKPLSAATRCPLTAQHPTPTPTRNQLRNQVPTWDGSPNTLPAFVEAIIKYLPKKNPNYRNLVEQGCRVEGRKTIFYSVNHVNRYANNEVKNRSGEKGTFRAPVIVEANQLVALVTPNPIVYAPNPTDTQIKLADSPFDAPVLPWHQGRDRLRAGIFGR